MFDSHLEPVFNLVNRPAVIFIRRYLLDIKLKFSKLKTHNLMNYLVCQTVQRSSARGPRGLRMMFSFEGLWNTQGKMSFMVKVIEYTNVMEMFGVCGRKEVDA